MNRILLAVKIAIHSRTAIVAALISFVFFLSLFVYSTIVTIPGNSLQLWIQFTPDVSKALVFLSAAALGVLFGLLTYSFKQKASVKEVGMGAAAAGTGFIAALIGTASCLSCLAPVLWFLGGGTLLSLLGFQQPILVLGLLVTIASIYLVSGPIAANCIECKPSGNRSEK